MRHFVPLRLFEAYLQGKPRLAVVTEADASEIISVGTAQTYPVVRLCLLIGWLVASDHATYPHV